MILAHPQVDVNYKDDKGCTALMITVSVGVKFEWNKEVVELA